MKLEIFASFFRLKEEDNLGNNLKNESGQTLQQTGMVIRNYTQTK